MRRVDRPCLLDSDSVRCLSYCESLPCAAALSLEDCSFKDLDSFAVTLFNLSVYFTVSPTLNSGAFSFKLLSFDLLNDLVHFV